MRISCIKLILGLSALLLPGACFSQIVDKPNYPQDYFRNPLNIPILLAGNFGECRPAHFHSGIDIKTNGVENQPVHAAADGYISRIKMDKGGYGHALYITHPNGYTTLYGHLNNFVPAIQAYMKEQQYKQQHWDIDIALSPTQFPVNKGQQIAWSGNTGSSTAPHLHFEIRDTKTEHPLNPEQFGFTIIDKEPPVATKLAVYDLNSSIYEQSPQVVTLQKKNGGYAPKSDTLLINTNMAGIALDVDDYMDGSTNTIAFYNAKLFLDDALQTNITMDDIAFDETRYVNAYADYKTKQQNGYWLQCLFQLPGNHLNTIYKYLNDKKGALMLNDNAAHKIRIEITDDRDNTSPVTFYIISDKSNSTAVCDDLFKASHPNRFEHPNVSFSLDENVLYDDVCFKYSSLPDAKAVSDRHSIQYGYVPAHRSFALNIKPNKVIPFSQRSKIAMLYNDGKNTDGRAAASTDQGWYTASVRGFGIYWLVADLAAPVIKPMQQNGANLSKAQQIIFTVKDDLTSVKAFSGYMDGKWICFEQHNDLFFYKFDEHCPAGKHTLVFKAADENNNTSTYTLTFTK